MTTPKTNVQSPPTKKIKTATPKTAGEIITTISSHTINGSAKYPLAWRTRIPDAIEEGVLKLPPDHDCQVSIMKAKSAIFPKAGNVAVVFGTIKIVDLIEYNKDNPKLTQKWKKNLLENSNPHVVAKVTPIHKDNNSLLWELCFQKIFANYVLQNHLTPNVVTFVDSMHCNIQQLKDKNSSFYKVANRLWTDRLAQTTQELFGLKQAFVDLSKEEKEQVKEEITENQDYTEYLITITEFTTGIPLHDWALIKRTTEEWRSVLFQLLYTIECFNRLGFRHNDLHTGNIYIENSGVNVNYTFIIEDDISNDLKYFVVPIGRTFIKIIDFDLSSVDPNYCDGGADELSGQKNLNQTYEKFKQCLGENDCKNSSLSDGLCQMYGMCNFSNTKFDAFTIFCYLLTFKYYQIPKKVENWIKTMVNINLINTPFQEQGGFTCRLGEPLAEYGYFPDNTQMLPVTAMLNSDFFKQWQGGFGLGQVDCDSYVFHLPGIDIENYQTFFEQQCPLLTEEE